MNSTLQGLGFILALIGAGVGEEGHRGKEKAKMKVKIGTFEGPVWFILIVFGGLLIIIGST